MDSKKLDLKELAKLSPFELKDSLIEAASSPTCGMHAMLNAGRGNPNFLATASRHGFFQLGLFAMVEAGASFAYMPEGVGGFPRRAGIEERFEQFLAQHEGTPGVHFLKAATSYVRDQLALDEGDFIYEMCEAILGCSYPVPDRMLKLSEKIVAEYLHQEMIGSVPFEGRYDLFAVEGGTAAMTYIFNTLRENFLIAPGDTIALATPIFTPYIEIPQLNDYQLKVLPLEATEEHAWQYTKKDLDALLDPRVKAFFLVNPSNPPSVKISDENLKYLGEIAAKRKDLIILTDDVYGTFADNFTSLFGTCPHNTILVYSFSKYFGSTGWRLGVIATHQDNILDGMLGRLSEAKKRQLDRRYASITTDPRKLKFIDRLVADSRTVALNHTAGLSTPQQVQMVLFALQALMDVSQAYKNAMKRLIRQRMRALYREIGIPPHSDENSVDYYHLLDIESIGRYLYGEDFVKWFLKSMMPNQALFELACESGIVLLPGKGFGSSHPSVRVSLANLNEADYAKIGRAVRAFADKYYEKYTTTRARAVASPAPARTPVAARQAMSATVHKSPTRKKQGT